MWNTKIEHDERGVSKMIHDFGSGVRVITNLQERTVARLHGSIRVEEWELEGELLCVDKYCRFLENISGAVGCGQ